MCRVGRFLCAGQVDFNVCEVGRFPCFEWQISLCGGRFPCGGQTSLWEVGRFPSVESAGFQIFLCGVRRFPCAELQISLCEANRFQCVG